MAFQAVVFSATVLSCSKVTTVPNKDMGCHLSRNCVGSLLDNTEVTMTDEEIAHYLNFGDASRLQTVEVNFTAWWLIDLHLNQQTRVVRIMDSVSTVIQDFIALAIPNSL
ncbi:hypothetical protein Pyn_15739 [Prunus yedoensis var. nudiflora]|uniref:Uncharacterized protein n=1 Tax=Prunus yedoensis var. nudiflora TaxID=2094558 RepID=A0A315A6Z7_PRUYE|nr:hypothetical protein Pyn_15739 [Prunus yedoensis var. nudiflora]